MPGRTTLVALAACAAALMSTGTALALDIADASPPSGVVGVPYSYTFSLSPGSGSPGASWSVSSGVLPPGLRLSSNDRTATVYGTPTQAGAFRFYLQVHDAPGPWVCCTEEEFVIAIDPGLDIATGADLPSGNVGAAYGYQLATAGGTASSWTITSGSLPPGMAFGSGGAITGTPTQAALSKITVRAVDGTRSASKQLTLRVIEPVVITAPAGGAVKLGKQFLVAFAAKGGLPPYTWTGVGLPEGVGVNATTGQVGGRPKAAGALYVTVQATDALGTVSTGHATVNVATKLAIVSGHLQAAHVGKRFAVRLKTSGGASPFGLRLAGTPPAWLSFDAAKGLLTGVPRLTQRKPLVVRIHTKHGVRTIVKRRPATPVSYMLYLTAFDALGQRATQKLQLTVRP
ncbi:MAG TPA: putative Ig domain-containing protein [Gaiella sp.]|nr:putative Ig domain-containing protein [Gaiella sp.]